MNILITGGTGFLGSAIAGSLASANRVSVISRGNKYGYLAKKDIKKLSIIECNLTDKKALKKNFPSDIDLVIHCAGLTGMRPDLRCPDDLIESNLISTINIIEAMIDNGVKRLVFSSSMTVYGVDNRIPVKESGILEPVHLYGLSKKWAEDAIRAYSGNDLISHLIIRYPGLYGYPRKSGYIYNTARRMIKNEDVCIDTGGLNFWETMNIEDAVEITRRILSSWCGKSMNETSNCSYGEETDFVSTASMIKKITGSSSAIKVKKPLGYIKFYLDNSRARRITGGLKFTFGGSLKRFLMLRRNWIEE